MSLFQKSCQFAKPFADHLFDVWLEPLPFPTIAKLFYSFCVLLVMALPLIYPLLILGYTYFMVQTVLKNHCGVVFPKHHDIMYLYRAAFIDEMPTIYLVGAKIKLSMTVTLASSLATLIDYLRLAASINSEFG